MKPPLRCILTAGLALALLSTSAHAITYPVFADTAGSPVTGLLSKSAGTATTLPVTAKSTAYIAFGMSGGLNVPTAGSVRAARLILYFPKVTKAGNLTVFVAGANELGPFSEIFPVGTTTQHLPATVAPIAVNPTFGIGFLPSKNFLFLDVTAEVKSWLNNPGTEFGFGISGDATVSVLIGSKEGSGTGYPAVLEVDVDPANITTSGSDTIFSGRLGIGAAPTAKLMVKTTGANVGLLHTNGTVSVASYVDGTRGWFGTETNHSLNFYTNKSGEQMTILPNGRVGIGTTTPGYPLTVAGSAAAPLNGSYGYGDGGGFSTNPVGVPLGGASPVVAIYAQNGGIVGGFYLALSDARIKKIVGQSDRSADLRTLLGIEITDYTYIDTVAQGSRPQKKVIAQQVEKVYPQAVSQNTDVVPDIYQKAETKDGWVQLATDLKVGDRVRLIGGKDQGVHEVLEVREGAFRTAFEPASAQVFVYGREVKDFRAVDYEAIAMLNVSATQELARKLEAKDAEIATLKAANLALAAKMAAFDEKLTALKASLDDRPARTVRAALDLK